MTAVVRKARRQRWYAANPEKRRAYHRVYRALKTGLLTRPPACEECGAAGRIEASHHDYDRPLDVLWLCVPCHRRRDRGAA